ncbi:hypothetical protein CPB83DRAFT_823118 [Crepidotus variabilis]|uniref:Flavin-containing monooxygenase n=1 Tax=Crepidotus variabilis TaxID=179855 RepID=A0A9P6E442_9AGAR|nr:hypothetical protein CPB83DRAFT_823118 [Crepidotus variabilis]
MQTYSNATPHPAETGLPNLTKLGNPKVPDNVDPQKIASAWLKEFAKAGSTGDVDGVLSLFVDSDYQSDLFLPEGSTSAHSPPDAIPVFWRDILAFTWDFRTFEGTPVIREFLQARLAEVNISNVQLQTDAGLTPTLDKPFPDLTWIQFFFKFETEVGLGFGIGRLVPLLVTGDAIWKAHLLFTNLEDLKGFPEQLGSRRNGLPNHGKWEEQRRKEVAFEDREPTVLVVGAGQSGLEVAARLKALGVDSLIVEKNEKVGDNWRTRYDALCLHDPVWYDHLPYLPFPSTWPVFTPAKKLANWLESYAEALELNVWTSTTVLNATQDPQTNVWSIKVKKGDGSERVFKVKHLVLAIGFLGGRGYTPTIAGIDKFKGQTLHSMEHKKATDHLGKKVVIIGACTSAHDICVDYADHGIDVTMFQRSSTYVLSTKRGVPMLIGPLYNENGPPTHIADRLSASFPITLLSGIHHRVVKLVAEVDKEVLEGLKSVGFRVNMGYKDAGLLPLVWTKASGYYMDVGGSQYIIDKKIKLKNDSQIQEFTETGLKFDNGSELSADVIVFCTGLADPKYALRTIFGDELADRLPQVWGLNQEGEIKGVFKEIGPKGLYVMMGNLGACRFYSKHIALQIKAVEEGLFDGRRYGRQDETTVVP